MVKGFRACKQGLLASGRRVPAGDGDGEGARVWGIAHATCWLASSRRLPLVLRVLEQLKDLGLPRTWMGSGGQQGSNNRAGQGHWQWQEQGAHQRPGGGRTPNGRSGSWT